MWGIHLGGVKNETIVDYFQRLLSTVYRVIAKVEREKDFKRKTCSGKKSKTSDREIKMIIQEVKKNPSITGNLIRKNLGMEHISERTVRRRINSHSEFASYWKVKKPFVSIMNRRKRLKWATEHLCWTLPQWRKVLWPDESRFVLIFNKRTRVWRRHNERYKIQHCNATIKHDKKINIWGCFCALGVGNLYRIEGILVKEGYNEIFKSQMLPSARKLFGRLSHRNGYSKKIMTQNTRQS